MPAPMFAHYPVARRGPSVPYHNPVNQNPALRGLPLHVAGSIISSFEFIQKFFWSNAGFGSLHDLKILDEYEPCYDPAVIPLHDGSAPEPAPYTAPNASYTPPAEDVPGRYYSVSDFHAMYKSGKVTPTQVVEALLPLIRRDTAPPGPHSTAFLESKVDLILKAAAESTLRYKEGKELGLLDGVPIAVKDEVDVDGYKKTFGTARDFTRKEGGTSWCVAKWLEEGAILVGKTNMHELGLDTTNNNPTHGTPRNPFNKNYYTGGSSGGSGYAVGAGLVPIALGLDGGGSVRIPASFCGVYGLKPSHGRVSESPSISSCSTTCVLGPIASTMEDIEISYRVMARPDPSHSVSSLFAVPRLLTGGRPKTIGMYNDWFDRADEPVRALCRAAVDYYTSSLGYTVVDIAIPYLPQAQMAHTVTILAEISSSIGADTAYLSPANKITVSVGSKTSSATFLQAQRMRQLQMQHLAALFKEHPGLIIVTPTTPIAGWHIEKGDIGRGLNNGNMSLRNMEYTYFANFMGVPAISLPVGYADPVEGEGKVPVGLMGMGEWGSEEQLIEFGKEGERYLNEVYKGGRSRAAVWTDVLSCGKSPAAAAATATNGASNGA